MIFWEHLQSIFLKPQNLLGDFMQSLSFQSHNLVVDYISLKFQELDNYTQTKIANYLFKIGFNSYQESGRLAKPIKEPIKVNFNNKFEVLFVGEGPY